MRPPIGEHSSLAGFSGRLDAAPPIGAAFPRMASHIPAKRRAQQNGHLPIVTAAGGLLSYGDSDELQLFNQGSISFTSVKFCVGEVHSVDVASLGGERDRSGRQPLSEARRSNGSFATKGKEALRAAAQRWHQPFEGHSSHSKSHKDEGLPTSLFAPFKGELPVDGKTLTEKEEYCDPMERSCQTPMHVWESKCTACYGSGTVSFSSRRGRRSSATCASCTGMGYVRRTSSRLIPDLNGSGKHLTIGRPIALDEEEYEEYMKSLRNGKRQ